MKEEKDTKVVPCIWYSEVMYKVSCSGVKSKWKPYLKDNSHLLILSRWIISYRSLQEVKALPKVGE